MYQPNVPYEPGLETREITGDMQHRASNYNITSPVIDHYFDNIHLKENLDSTRSRGNLESTTLLDNYKTNGYDC
ncbi:MAG: hypothetical protein KKH52_05130 [Nanoarchaeota archaeon]|nr:hypothetical protein [Nanoarchaeota archaeon]MBU1622230.1 hypothetical protein [Nanoarchaeota archaeon]MBU1974749.1 hypothetical protein [Nanoarchaeota archaeon]